MIDGLTDLLIGFDTISFLKLQGITIDWLNDRLIDWMIDWLIDWMIDWLIDWLTDWLIDWFIGFDTISILILQGIMLVYEITDEKSFENIAKWLRNIDEVDCLHTKLLFYVIHYNSFPLCLAFLSLLFLLIHCVICEKLTHCVLEEYILQNK